MNKRTFLQKELGHTEDYLKKRKTELQDRFSNSGEQNIDAKLKKAVEEDEACQQYEVLIKKFTESVAKVQEKIEELDLKLQRKEKRTNGMTNEELKKL